jgi:hypothetical protein
MLNGKLSGRRNSSWSSTIRQAAYLCKLSLNRLFMGKLRGEDEGKIELPSL